MSSLKSLVKSGSVAWDVAACKGQRLPILHQMQHEARQHKNVGALEESVMRGLSQAPSGV